MAPATSKRSVGDATALPITYLPRIRAVPWDPKRFLEIGRGGEATIFALKPDTVAKVFHTPDTLEFADNPGLQDAAVARIAEMQTKLDAFPRDLPTNVVAPSAVLVNGRNRVFGYCMAKVTGMGLDRCSRTTGIGTSRVIGSVLTKLHDLVVELHAHGMVIGDLNEQNVIVARAKPYLIDADAMQFGAYHCRTFTPRFTAPELIGIERPRARRGQPAVPAQCTLIAEHTEMTDWYAYLVIAMRLLTFTDPFGGVVSGMDLTARIAERITVFDRRVVYPAVARPLADMPRAVLEQWFRMFHLGERFIPDREPFVELGGTPARSARSTPSTPTLPVRQRRKRHVATGQPRAAAVS